ncbi:MCM-domain-containing protein [Piromyces finnis]|uniref:DNA replication licensing factor MCM5 n=1 Tax=Piromyces finnis TaxID=1754191 RepID=A0A1Y1VKT3_9FUNG|nr:MCM-domain-containing protein [Piromyces finnis]|eukprot:ORX58496.1 MCM-domain-containing protein [Piromyces finnis]
MANVGGWDASQVYYANALPPQEQENQENDEPVKIQQEFLNFIRNFRINNEFPYREQLNSCADKNFCLKVNLTDLINFNGVLANNLREKPAVYLPLFESALQIYTQQQKLVEENDTFAEFQVTLISNARSISIRDLDSTYMSKLVNVPGIVISSSTLSAKATHIHIMCRSCRNTKILKVNGGFTGVTLPRRCDSKAVPGVAKECPMDPYIIVNDKCKFIDQQAIKLQETPEMVPVGELPRHLLLSVDRNNVNKLVPGSRIIVTGIYSSYQNRSNRKSSGAVAIRSPYLRVVGISYQQNNNGRDQRTFSDIEEAQFLKISHEPDLKDKFIKSIAPSIFGHDAIKKAISCLLFGGSKKILPDGMKLRGDINILLLGDPGTAKSQLLKFVSQVAPVAVYTSGKGSSAAGLTASVIRDPGSREFYLEGGAMVLADGGVVCIDEFDKMREEDRVAIHEAMEQQTISIAKAGITTILNSRTSVLAAANPVFGRYDEMKMPGENIDFQTTILSRFDMIFIIRDEHNEERDKDIARHVLNVHMNVPNQDVSGEFSIPMMRDYISYCKSKCAPHLSEEAAARLRDNFVSLRSEVKKLEEQTSQRTSIPITIRQLEAIIRISESFAKMRLSTVVTESDVQEALELFKNSTMDAVTQGQGEGNLTRSEVIQNVQRVEQQIRERLPLGSRISERSLKNDLYRRGFDDTAIGHALFILIQKGTLQYQRRNMILIRSGV